MTDLENRIVIAYARNDMSIARTAKELCYHDNTITYRLNRIFEKYRLNPRCFYDLIKLVEIAKGDDVI